MLMITDLICSAGLQLQPKIDSLITPCSLICINACQHWGGKFWCGTLSSEDASGNLQAESARL